MAATSAAQTPPGPNTLRLTVDEAVKMAIDQNVDLAVARFDPQVGDTQVAAAYGVYRPAFTTGVNRNNQLQPPASFLVPIPTRNDAVTSSVGLTQKLPWFGTSYSVSWNAVHTDSNSILNSYNPIVQSGLSLAVSQPLIRDQSIDFARQQLAVSQINRDIADTQLRDTLVHTTAEVKRTYWNLESARANVDARKIALDLSNELTRVNKAKVDIGQSPPLDLVSAQAEVASDEEQVIIAETTVKQVEDRLRTLIFDTSDQSVWSVQLDPADTPPVGQAPPDLDAAVINALRDRTDLARARKDIDTAQVNVKFTANQRLPDVRLNAGYVASGLGGTQVLRTGDFPGTVVGPGSVTNFGSVLNQLFTNQYPTWNVGVNVTYPIGQSTEEANHARAKLEQAQSRERLKSAQAHAVEQIRNAWRQIDMNAKRIETARAALELAKQRFESERKRFEVGMSTSFLVIQAQRDLVQAKTNELDAVLAYDLALVDFDELQQAGPATEASPASPTTATIATTTGTTITTPRD
jgi:HAE1 family hydrophobic/amphiphilic exporter-1